jgi:hypothetical protein
VPLGLATGFLAWFAAGGASASADRLDPLRVQVANLKAPNRSEPAAAYADISGMASTPIFVLTTGPAAIKEPAVRVDGLSVSRRRVAALLSIDGQPAQWMSVGEKREGFTLVEVSSTRVLIETLAGPKAIALGEQAGSVAATPAPIQTAAAPAPDQVPPGFRSPPPPASAPTAP